VATRLRPSSTSTNTSKPILWIPVAAAIAYPWSLIAFHQAAVGGSAIVAAIWLAVAFALPLLSLLLVAYEAVRGNLLTPAVRRVAYAALAAPPLYVFVGVASGLLKSPVPERTLWIAMWIVVGLIASVLKTGNVPVPTSSANRLRFAHGVTAAFISLFIVFHLFNHLSGLIGPQMHAHIMEMGRRVYRSSLIEPVFIALLFFQIVSGLRLAWRGSRRAADLPRVIQIGSGAYIAAFLIAHMNSALISARHVHHIDTNWAWASGGRTGLLLDAWNIRLVPHYALGVFFIVIHIASGMRFVLLGHGLGISIANRFLWVSIGCAAVLSASILAGLCGVRL
jgi:hypothetical protein